MGSTSAAAVRAGCCSRAMGARRSQAGRAKPADVTIAARRCNECNIDFAKPLLRHPILEIASPKMLARRQSRRCCLTTVWKLRARRRKRSRTWSARAAVSVVHRPETDVAPASDRRNAQLDLPGTRVPASNATADTWFLSHAGQRMRVCSHDPFPSIFPCVAIAVITCARAPLPRPVCRRIAGMCAPGRISPAQDFPLHTRFRAPICSPHAATHVPLALVVTQRRQAFWQS
jgi:hypothetical protein